MPMTAPSNGLLRLSILAPCAEPLLVAPSLAKHLGLTIDQSIARLSGAPCVLSNALPAATARQIAAILASFGVTYRLEISEPGAVEKPPLAARVDLSIQPLETSNLPNVAKALSHWLPSIFVPALDRDPQRIEAALAAPGGLVLKGLDPAEVTRIRTRLRRVDGLLAAVSNPVCAIYDLLPDPATGFALSVAFLTDLKRFGLGPCKLTGAVAARLNQRTCLLMTSRYPKLRLIPLNQDFQRFDLFLTGAGTVTHRELADFLISRSDLPRNALDRLPRPLKIETGLTRANALAFQSDYAALGLETCARLRVYHPQRPAVQATVAQNTVGPNTVGP